MNQLESLEMLYWVGNVKFMWDRCQLMYFKCLNFFLMPYFKKKKYLGNNCCITISLHFQLPQSTTFRCIRTQNAFW